LWLITCDGLDWPSQSLGSFTGFTGITDLDH